MNPIKSTAEQIPKAEIDRRIKYYCEEAYKQQAMPHALYQIPFIVCPWPDCDREIAGVDFQLEKGNDPAFYQLAVNAWWRGAGIAARCPACENLVLFSVGEKKCLEESDLDGHIVLADDWHTRAYIMN